MCHCIEGPNYAGDCSGKQNHLWQIDQREKLEVMASSAASSITAGQNLNIAGGDVVNASSTIGAGGNLSVAVNNLTNSGVETGETDTSRLFVSERTRHPEMWYDAAAAFNSRYSIGGASYNPNDLSGLQGAMASFIGITEAERTVLRTVTQIGGGDQSYAGVIQAGGAVNVKAQANLDNSVVRPGFTYVGAGAKTGTGAAGASGASAFSTRITVNGQLPPDLAQRQINPLTLPGFSLPTGQNGLFRLSGQGSSATASNNNAPGWSVSGASLQLDAHPITAPSTAGRLIQVNAPAPDTANSVQLDLASRQASGIGASGSGVGAISDGGAASIQTPDRSSAAPAIGASLPNTPQKPAGPDNPSLIASQSIARVQGLANTQPVSQPQKYLIETNPVLTDLKQFMSSDYLLSGLGYNPDDSAKRLGDGLYEQRLVEQAVVARTGQRFIDGQNSDSGMLKYLMDNAISSKQQLGLSVGVSLTSAQVAALTHDIVWLENEQVNGENVLVPVVYLAQANNRLAPDGALIAGNDVNLIAGQNLDNVGTLRASNNLSAQAGNDLSNSGLIQAGNRLDLLAGNNIVNTAGGIIAGRDVNLTASNGDILNERSVTSHDSSSGYRTEHTDSVDSAARIEAANNLSLQAGRDVDSVGGVTSSGADTTIKAGRDVNLVAAEGTNSNTVSGLFKDSSVSQYGSRVDAGGDLKVQAGRDISAVASEIDAKRDVTMSAVGDLSLSSAADESHASFTSKKVKSEDDHVSQVSTTVKAGGDVALSAGQDLALTASRVTAGDEAYLYAGNTLDLNAAQDSDYSLYDMKKKGGFGALKTQHDEVTDVRNVGSQIQTGGALSLISGGDQVYQNAKLDSGANLSLNSGGSISFEAVKDLHQESHSKSDSSLAWTSMSGKGSTDETLRQTEMTAKGQTVINAVNGLNIGIKQIDQNTVAQTIDVMVKADPSLAWLKDAEARGDVNWQQVKEMHDAYKYSHSSLGEGAMLAIIIIVSVLTAGAASGAVAAMSGAGAGSTMAAATAEVAATATTAAVDATTAGLGNMMASAVLTSMASSGAVSLINNKGNLGATLKDALSTSSLKNDVLAGLTAGIGYELPYNPAVFSVDNLEKAAVTSVANAVAKTAVEGGSLQGNLVGSLAGAAINVGGATVANDIGGTYLPDGSLTKIGMHALLGGVLSVAQGGDFKTGALAAGADEAVVKSLSDLVMPDPATANSVTLQQAQQRLVALSGLVGILAATATGGNASIGASVAENATQNNFLGPNSIARREADRQALEYGTATVQQAAEYKELQQRDQQSDYLRSKVAAGDSLTDAERSFLVDSYQQYYDEMVSKVGGGLADAALSGLKQNGAITTYDFPFAGTPQQKAEWTDANSQTPLDFLKTAFRSRSEDETLYNGIGHSEQIAKAQEQDVQIGQIAMLPEEGLAGIAAIGAVTIGKAISAGSEAGGALPSTLGLGKSGAGAALELDGVGANGAASEGLETTNNSLPSNSSQLSHIFRDDVGHLMDTPENQQALVNLTNNPANRLGTDRFGNQWFAQIQSDGSQLWGSVRNGVVQNGGLNTTPRNFNPATGLSKGK